MRRPARQTRREPTIALINIVFLMLIFFLVAGTVAQPMDRGVRLVRTADLDGSAPPDALVLHADGRVTWRGETVDSADAASLALLDGTVRLVPDRALPADRLIAFGRAMRSAGAESVLIVTERGLE